MILLRNSLNELISSVFITCFGGGGLKFTPLYIYMYK